jgi:hypothetical protein
LPVSLKNLCIPRGSLPFAQRFGVSLARYGLVSSGPSIGGF